MAFTQSQLDKLEAAIATGARSIEYDGRKITYNSMAEMRELQRAMRIELGHASPSQASYLSFER